MDDAAHADLDLLASCLERLRTEGTLEYIGEYGAEITTFVPFVAWLHAEGHLNGRRIVTYAGMRPYYFFLDDSQYEEKPQERHWLPIAQRHWPGNSTYHAVRSPWHVYPDFRRQYATADSGFDRPILYVQNKFVIEWGIGPINFIPLNALERLLEWTKDRFQIVYSRAETMNNRRYASDQNSGLDYPDLDIVRRHPHALHFEQHCRDAGGHYNEMKLAMLAKTHLFVATQGGGAHILACFGNSLMLLLDRADIHGEEGAEYPHAYRSGPYKYLSTPSPMLMVARNHADFTRGLRVMADAKVSDGSIALHERHLPTLEELRL